MKWLVDEDSDKSEVTELSDSRMEGSRVTSVLTLAGKSGGKGPELVPELAAGKEEGREGGREGGG